MLVGFVGEEGDVGAAVVGEEAGEDGLEWLEEAVVGGEAGPADGEFFGFVVGGGAGVVACDVDAGGQDVDGGAVLLEVVGEVVVAGNDGVHVSGGVGDGPFGEGPIEPDGVVDVHDAGTVEESLEGEVALDEHARDPG